MTVTLQFNTMPSHAPLRNFPMHHGRLSLAFAGTVGDRGSLRTERLESPQALAAWFQAAGLATATVDIKPRAYARALELREAIARTAQAFVAHKKPARADIALINSVANSSSPRIALDAKSLSVVDTVREPVGAALARIARDAIEMFGNADERSRLRSCGMDSCGSLFLTPAGRRERRWCTMARCGNRAKASAHRERVAQA